MFWTNHEIEALRQLYRSASWEELQAACPRHDLGAIRSRVAHLRLQRRTPAASSQHAIIMQLRARRRELKMSAAELSRRLECDRTSVFRWERGAVLPLCVTLERWAEILGFRLQLVEIAGGQHEA